MNQKGFAPILIIILIALTVGGIIYLLGKNFTSPASQPNISQKLQNATEKSSYQDIYKSPLGFSFKKLSSGEITEYSYDIDKLSSLKDSDLVYPPKSDTTLASVGTRVETDAYTLTVTKMDAVGLVPLRMIEKMGYGGGDFFQFLNENKLFFNEVQNLIAKKITPTNSDSFKDMGQFQRYGVVSYTNSSSKLTGMTNFVIGGFTTPGLGLGKEYFLFDERNKYIVYIYSTLSCNKKDELESKNRKYKKDGTYTIDSSFNADEYIDDLHLISPDCENTSKNKTALDLLLDSLIFN